MAGQARAAGCTEAARTAGLFNRRIDEQLVAETDAKYLGIDFGNDQSMMASDGFHPGPRAYAVWGQLAAGLIINQQRLTDQAGTYFAG